MPMLKPCLLVSIILYLVLILNLPFWSHRRSQGAQVYPQGDEKKFLAIFCWNEAKMGLNLVRCTPADEIKR